MSFETFFYHTRRVVYKWWCVVYKPVYKVFHQGYWPNEKNPYAVFPEKGTNNQNMVNELSQTASASDEIDIAENLQSGSTMDGNVSNSNSPSVNNTADSSQQGISSSVNWGSNTTEEETIDTSGMDEEALKRANEIMARLAMEAAEDDAKKQSEIDKARAVAEEQEKLASIMNANKVDISGFIEEGRQQQKLQIK